MASGVGAVRALPLRRLLVSWRWYHVGLTLGVLALLVGAIAAVPEVSTALGTAGKIWTRPDLLGLFFASYSAAFFLRALAWKALLRESPGALRLFGFLQAALLANHLLPTKAGELVRVGLLTRTGTPVTKAASSTLVARLLDLGSLCLLAIAFAPLAGGYATSLVALALPLSALVAAVVGLWALGSGRLAPLLARLPSRVAAMAGVLEDAARSISPTRAGLALAVTLPSWLLEALALWSVAQASGVEMSLALAIAATAFTIAFQGFQVTPGGIGIYEASLTGVLVLAGLDPATALGLAVSTHALKFAYSFAVGLPSLLVEVASDVGAGPRRVLASVGGWVHPSLLLAGVAVGATALLSGVEWSGLAGVGLGAVAALPVAVLSRRHYLPRALLVVLPVLAVGSVTLFGVGSGIAMVAAGLLALGLVLLGVSHWSAVLWALVLSQLVGAGVERPGEVAVATLVATGAAVLARQWWLSWHPWARVEPLVGGTIAVVIPVHDEAESIGQVVARVPTVELAERGFEVAVIVVDDGSRDGSGAVALATGADRIVRHADCRGLGAAVRAGLETARNSGAVAAVYLDGDGEYDAADIARVVEPVLQGEADYVLGNRFPEAGRLMGPARLAGNLGFTWLQRLLTGRWIGDGQTGFRAFSSRALAVAEIGHDYNYAQVLTLDLLRKGARLAEVPISYRQRVAGQSFVRYGEYGRRVLPAIIREVLSP